MIYSHYNKNKFLGKESLFLGHTGKKDVMIVRVAYQKSAGRLRELLSEMGYELFPYEEGVPYDALLFEENILPRPTPGERGTLLINSTGLTESQVGEILERRLYSPLFQKGLES